MTLGRWSWHAIMRLTAEALCLDSDQHAPSIHSREIAHLQRGQVRQLVDLLKSLLGDELTVYCDQCESLDAVGLDSLFLKIPALDYPVRGVVNVVLAGHLRNLGV